LLQCAFNTHCSNADAPTRHLNKGLASTSTSSSLATGCSRSNVGGGGGCFPGSERSLPYTRIRHPISLPSIIPVRFTLPDREIETRKLAGFGRTHERTNPLLADSRGLDSRGPQLMELSVFCFPPRFYFRCQHCLWFRCRQIRVYLASCLGVHTSTHSVNLTSPYLSSTIVIPAEKKEKKYLTRTRLRCPIIIGPIFHGTNFQQQNICQAAF
jgi:hypothetical protein